MDGVERAPPHRYGSSGRTSGSEFFICFTSRPSSSSMRIPSSKSLPSPGRADKYRDAGGAAPSLSASVSRRLKNSGSVKGGQSPATILAGGGSRRKSSSFEAAEPSSPKVTCIGQVKVKTARMKKKKKKTLRSASQRSGRGAGGETTSGRLEHRAAEEECPPNRNQRRAYPPLSSICGALRAFGSEINCFLPCIGGGRSPCSSAGVEEKGEPERGGERRSRLGEKRERNSGTGSCGTAFARWLMTVHDGEDVTKDEDAERVMEDVGARGVGLFLDVEMGGVGEREGRQNALAAAAAAAAAAVVAGGDEKEPVCVPPPNALLLMRCRSDPVRMAALANRFLSCPAASVEVEEDEADNEAEKRVEDPTKRFGNDTAEGAAGAAIVTDQKKPEEAAPFEVADEKHSGGGCVQETESSEGKTTPLRGEQDREHRRYFQEKGESDGGRHRQTSPGTDNDVYSYEVREAPPCIENSAVKEEDAAAVLAESPSLAAPPLERSEILLPETEQEQAAGDGGVGVPTQPGNLTGSEGHCPRPRLTGEREGRRCVSKEKESRRHSFSTEKEARRTSSSREGRRSSFSADGDATNKVSFSSEGGEGRRRWSFSTEKEARRPLAEAAAEAAAVAVVEKRRKKKKKKGEDDQEPGATEGGEFAAGATSVAVPPAVAAEGGERLLEKLPDCLLLMMYEPKLSMEVSRETWVCTSDFLRCRPHHNRQATQQLHQAVTAQGVGAPAVPISRGGGEENASITVGTVAEPIPPPPPPPPPPAPTVVVPALAVVAATMAGPLPETKTTPEKKVTSAGAVAGASPYAAPLGLTRCKSEPVRSSSRLEPDACFWKSRHHPPVGAAGIGF